MTKMYLKLGSDYLKIGSDYLVIGSTPAPPFLPITLTYLGGEDANSIPNGLSFNITNSEAHDVLGILAIWHEEDTPENPTDIGGDLTWTEVGSSTVLAIDGQQRMLYIFTATVPPGVSAVSADWFNTGGSSLDSQMNVVGADAGATSVPVIADLAFDSPELGPTDHTALTAPQVGQLVVTMMLPENTPDDPADFTVVSPGPGFTFDWWYRDADGTVDDYPEWSSAVNGWFSAVAILLEAT